MAPAATVIALSSWNRTSASIQWSKRGGTPFYLRHQPQFFARPPNVLTSRHRKSALSTVLLRAFSTDSDDHDHREHDETPTPQFPKQVVFINTERTLSGRFRRFLFLARHNWTAWLALLRVNPAERTDRQKRMLREWGVDMLRIFITIFPSFIPLKISIVITVVWLLVLAYKPNAIIPRILNLPRNEDVSNFIIETLEYYDPKKTGLVDIHLAKAALRFVDKDISHSEMDDMMKKAGLSEDGTLVNYIELSRAVYEDH